VNFFVNNFPCGYCLGQVLNAIKEIQDAMSSLLALPEKVRDRLCWLTHNGCLLLSAIAAHLAQHFYAPEASAAFTFAVLAMEASLPLSGVRYLPLRIQVVAEYFIHSLHFYVF
jgi:hypothetical protein